MVNVKVGERAPEFNLLDMDNRPRSLTEFQGQSLVLVFCVEAFTAGATKEHCTFRDSMAQLVGLNAQILGVCVNPPSANKLLIERNRLPFPVLSDNKREASETYGLKPSSSFGVRRAVFVVDGNGIVRYSWESKNSDEPDFEEVKRVLRSIEQKEPAAKLHGVITISRQVGSGGDEIALKVSEILGYAVFDKNLMVDVAKSIGLSEEEIADFSEDTYRIKSFVDTILLRKTPSTISPTAARGNLDEERYLSAIQAVIRNVANRGKTVIVGRGGQAILKNKPSVLHVRIVAPKAVRVKRIMDKGGLSEEAALRLIEDSDKTAAEYLRRFYGVDWADPLIYDMILNTGKMDPNLAAKTIAWAMS